MNKRVNSYQKGARREREAIALCEQIFSGVTFKRNRDQFSQKDLADLKASVPGFILSLEIKGAATGDFKIAWLDQAQRAAKLTGQLACVLYKIDRKDWRMAMTAGGFLQLVWGPTDEFVDLTDPIITTPETIGTLVNESMSSGKWICTECGGKGVVEKVMKDPTGFPYEIDVTVTCDYCKGLG